MISKRRKQMYDRERYRSRKEDHGVEFTSLSVEFTPYASIAKAQNSRFLVVLKSGRKILGTIEMRYGTTGLRVTDTEERTYHFPLSSVIEICQVVTVFASPQMPEKTLKV